MKRILPILAVILLLLVVLIAGLWAIGGRTDVYDLEITINASPERVFPYLTDPQLLPKWLSGLVESKPITEGGLRVGAKSIETIAENGQSFTMESEITRYEPNREMQVRLTSDMLEVLADYELQPEGNGTKLRYTATMNYKGFITRVMAPLLSGSIRNKLEGDMSRLKQLVEAGK